MHLIINKKWKSTLVTQYVKIIKTHVVSNVIHRVL